jgi:hypothetical protein
MSSHLYKYKINKLLKVSKYLSLNIFFVSSLLPLKQIISVVEQMIFLHEMNLPKVFI